MPQSEEQTGSNAERSVEQEAGISVWFILGIVGVAAAILLAINSHRREPEGPYVGRPLPPLQAAGWLNTDKPLTTADLQGKVVLVDYWATWCGPCVHGIPDVIAFHKRYRDAGVLVIGLTSESGAQVQNVRGFVETKAGMDYPVGYGAGMTMHMMDIDSIPTYMLYDRTGACIWGGHSLAGIEEATVKALAKK